MAPENGQVVVNGTTPGDTVTYSCNLGYQVEGINTVTCGDDGTWSAGPPVCRREFQPLLNEFSTYIASHFSHGAYM